MHQVHQRRTERVVVRCSAETLEEWRSILYEAKKRGLCAEDLLKEALRYLKNTLNYPGRVY